MMPSRPAREATLKRLADHDTRQKLVDMESSPAFNTRTSSYSANAKLYPGGQIPFVDKHMAYLIDHPKLDPEQYLANLRLLLRKR